MQVGFIGSQRLLPRAKIGQPERMAIDLPRMQTPWVVAA